jgi:TonB family protein
VTVNFTPQGAGGQPSPAPIEMATQVEPKRSPRVIKDVKPRYPEEGLEAKVSGTVEVAVTIGTDGKVSAAHVVRGVPMFNQAALDAAYQWEFEPVGQPVEVNIEFSFAARSNR